MTRYQCATLLSFFLAVASADADQIMLTNGDRVTGSIVTSDAETITVKTELMGDVKIQRSGITGITAEKGLNVTLAGGETISGSIATQQNELRVRREDASEVTAPIESEWSIRDDESQRKWEREQERRSNPGWLDFWAGDIKFGLASARGNSRTTTLSTGADAQRVTGFDKVKLTFAQIYSTQNTTEPFGSTANRVNGTARYDRNISKKLFVFTFGDFTFDEFQDLDLRSVLGGGLGYRIFQRENSYWNVGVGGNWNREKFATGDVRNSAEANFSEESSHLLIKGLKAFQGLSFFPNLSQTGEYRFDFDGGLTFKVNSHLSLNLTVSDRFLSNPLPGKRKNDLLFSTGVVFSFAQN